MIPAYIKLKSKKLPDSPGVYLMKGKGGELLYVGKAGNLRRRVESYFAKAHEYRIEKLVKAVQTIDYKKTDTAIEALILESDLIKKHQPPYNVREKDDKSFLYVEITREKFPRVLLVRGKDVTSDSPRLSSGGAGKRQPRRPARAGVGAPTEASEATSLFGPFTSAAGIREALRILRRIFPWSVHSPSKVTNDRIHLFGRSLKKMYRGKTPCFDYQIRLCPGTCVGAISRADYLKNIRNVKLFFAGRKARIVKLLEREMTAASRALEFEKAEILKRQIFGLKHIQDVAFIKDDELKVTSDLPTGQAGKRQVMRIEGYDISNISGTSAAGSMVVFINGKPDVNEYRKFRIKTVIGSNDVAMMKEVLERRFHHAEWRYPDLILVDGGLGQVNAARAVLRNFRLKIPVVGIAKGPERKKNELVGAIPENFSKKILIRVRDEAHRFAIGYHREVRRKQMGEY